MGTSDVAAKWRDPNTRQVPSQELRDAWGSAPGGRSFGVFDRPPRVAPVDAAGQVDADQSTLGSSASSRGSHHQRSVDAFFGAGAAGKRARHTRVLSRGASPERGSGIPMGGVVVHFPDGLSPHVPQKIVMSKVIASLQKKQNALIESPTGTGKSLSLLCSALAWLEKEKKRVDEANEEAEAWNEAAKRRWAQHVYNTSRGIDTKQPGGCGELKLETAVKEEVKEEKENDPSTPADVPLTDCQPESPHVHVHKIKGEDCGTTLKAEGTATVRVRGDGKPDAGSRKFDPFDPATGPPQWKMFQQAPKIYLCSRTHSQLHQLVRELKRTPYRPKYTILGSRKQYCPIQKSDEECLEMTKDKLSRPTGTQCGYFNNKSALVAELQHARIWDMEDLDAAASEHMACSFFAMRDFHQSAELVLCPYNYIFDPNIRAAQKIDLSNAAVIIDEGHNIEDVCRDGASVEVKEEELSRALTDLEAMSKYFDQAEDALRLLRPFNDWVEDTLRKTRDERGRSSFGNLWSSQQGQPVRAGPGETIWKGEEAVTALLSALAPSSNIIQRMRRDGTGADDRQILKTYACQLIGDALNASSFDGDLMQRVNKAGGFGAGALAVTNKLCLGLASMVANARDYVMCACDLENQGGGGGRNNPKPGLALWCLRPAVSFRPVAKEALCVILTSGTLSPTESLQGELGVDFPVKVEAPHIVPRRQLHVEATAALGDFTRAAQNSEKMPQNLGTLLMRYVKLVPGGILVFLPKYSLVTRIMEEWENCGMLAQLEAHKVVVAEEPGAQTLAGTLDTFRSAVASGKGALFLAVYRGKVSEGLDFKDENARAVFCVGIPFPNLGDVKVKLKREYNNYAESRKEGMLPGGDWYQHQAFRAYNQALGRCVRHQHDYASIFLVDARFCMHDEAAHNRSMVSKWMRNHVQHFQQVRESVGTVSEFFETLEANPPGPSLPPANAAAAGVSTSAPKVDTCETAETKLMRGVEAATALEAATSTPLPSVD